MDKVFKNYIKSFENLNKNNIHSVTLGSLRFPKEMFNKITKLYPEEKLFSFNLLLKNNSITFNDKIEIEMMEYCNFKIQKYFNNVPIFSCTPY